jgi:hypothetical protein
MAGDHHLDVNKAVDSFLKHNESLSCLPFISEVEMETLFGDDVNSALAELERYNQQGQICRNCDSRCCRLVDCELYTAELSRCPVHHWRPALCRLHFCNKFSRVYPLIVRDAGDIYLESLIAAERRGIKITYLFDCPPLAKLAPELVTAISSYLSAFKEGRSGEARTIELIEAEIDKMQHSDYQRTLQGK